MTNTTVTNSAAHPGLEEARRALDAKLGELVTKMDRFMLPPENGGMSAAERVQLIRVVGASDATAARTRMNWELTRLRGRLEALESRLPPKPDRELAPDRIAAGSREEADQLRASRAFLAREVFSGRAARLPDLEEVEARIRALDLEAERAALVAVEYPNPS
jgi:hypothetical protein